MLIRSLDGETRLKLRFKVPLMLGVVAISSSLMMAITSYQIGVSAIDLAEEEITSIVQSSILSLLQDANGKSLARADLISRLPFVQKDFASRSRDELFKSISPSLKVQKERFFVSEAQFHLPPATSYLRVYKPNAKQEDLSSFREMVLKVNKDKLPLSGIEIGRRGIGIRGVVPINNNGVHAGSFEIAMEFKPVLNNLKKLTGYDAAVFIDEERMSKIATLIPTPDPEKIIGGMRVQESTNWRLLRGITNPDIINSTKEALTEKKFYDGEDYSLIITPLVDYKGQQIGLIVAAKSLKYTDDLKHSLFWNNIFLAFGQALVVTAFASVFFNGLLLRPILSLGKNIKDISEDTHVSDSSPNSLDPLLNRRDEVGEIARDCKELQIRISDYNQGNNTSS